MALGTAKTALISTVGELLDSLGGVLLVWVVDPTSRTVEEFTSPDNRLVLHEGDCLTGGSVLPGFSLPVGRLFDRPVA